jgi:hypothetical protein
MYINAVQKWCFENHVDHNIKKTSSGKHFPSYNTNHIKNDASIYSYIVACVFVVAVMFLPSRCLAARVGYTYRHRLMGEINEVCR